MTMTHAEKNHLTQLIDDHTPKGSSILCFVIQESAENTTSMEVDILTTLNEPEVIGFLVSLQPALLEAIEQKKGLTVAQRRGK